LPNCLPCGAMSAAESETPVHFLRWWTSGKAPLGRQGHADVVIELQDDCAAGLELSTDRTEFLLGAPIVEPDLAVQDYEDEGCAAPSAWQAQSAPYRLERRPESLQHCMICLQEKPHTLVPPHRSAKEEATPARRWWCYFKCPWRRDRVEERTPFLKPNVDSHRFCTECWAEYLAHVPAGEVYEFAESKLACPICRETIDVPDVWAVKLGVPEALRVLRSSDLRDDRAGKWASQRFRGKYLALGPVRASLAFGGRRGVALLVLVTAILAFSVIFFAHAW